MRTEILYEDDSILVTYKPAGLAVQTARVGQPDVVSELKNYLQQPQAYLGVIHRLDQPVEGLLVFAKNKKTAAALSAQLQRQGDEGTFSKAYYAVLCGIPKVREAELVNYLYKNQDNRAMIMNSPAEKAGMSQFHKAVLRYRILQTAEIGKLTLADIHIDTGRFHQIRAQMAHAGMPILGDVKYGNRETVETARILGICETALCAYLLDFVHPVSGKKMKFQIAPRGKAFSLFDGYNFEEK